MPNDREAPRLSLGAKLIFFSTLLTAIVVCASLVILSLALKRHTRQALAHTLAEHEQTLSQLQRDSTAELLRNATLMTGSPTLRAAMVTFDSESGASAGGREELLATIQTEADKLAAGLGRDLLLVTDRAGRVLARSGPAGAAHPLGEDLSGAPLVRRVLDLDDPVGAGNFGVLELGGEDARLGCAPIVLQGYLIGTLILGDRVDHRFAERLQRSLGCDLVIAADDRVMASTLPEAISPPVLAALAAAPRASAEAPWVATLHGEEYVTAVLALGADARGRDVRVYLLQSLTKSLGDSNRFLVGAVLACGGLAILVAGIAAWSMSRSVLRPLEEFVAFMRSVAGTGDHARRFVDRSPCLEVQTLADAYHQLMESLLEHERRLIRGAREELERLERLQESEKLAALGRMLSGAAHEINNPLTGVLGNVEMLLRDEGLPAHVRERLVRVSREGQRVSALVRNVLKLSHRDTGETSVVELNALLREVADVRRHDFVGSGLRLDLELESDAIPVLGSELELGQVFLNIVSNAYDALRETGRTGRLVVRASIVDGSAVVVFDDDGPGMKNPKQVFEHFYTTKPVGKGTGLGLSICYAVVERHGGRIRAENRPGGGARFVVELPSAGTPGAIAAGERKTAHAPADASAGLAASVLVVDDEPTLVDLQREILEALGAVVVGVGSGPEAIEQLRTRTFDLIVTDMKMQGGVSGADLFRWVESHRPEATRAFVFVTGDQAGDGSLTFVDSVGARCVMKPFTADDYVQAVREAYEESRRAS
ncbi:MAG TPA: hybrid sensor histidine kinase/response regulator [Candidatus Sulfotelmatobacter sp.]|jgi:signal transduction histidine kinase/ActR/RegA family two-component response regulator|nr:hybrid sensor histidine kinase/response regulator [Candidatus Sulfotelmatobacter sp.]